MGMRTDRNDRSLRALALFGTAMLALAAAGCSTKPAVPFRPEPIAYADTLPSAQPAETEPREVERLLEASVGGEIGRVFSLRRWVGAQHEALNVTRFDDVVNSAWFEHRNGHRAMSPEEVGRGPTTVGPDTSRTLTVIGGKSAGVTPGFTVRDANGTMFLFKFDPKGNPQLSSAAGVISNRLVYAAGYHTPEDYIVVFDSARLELHPEAEIDTDIGERRMTEADIRTVLSGTDALPDGRFLALASSFVPGAPLGPFLFTGVREDDPNDHYHHEHRRELRGLYVISAWLNHIDMRFANSLDVFIDPPGYVRHYLIDFAATLGSGTTRSHNPREGLEYNYDFWATMGRLVTFGFFEKGWEEAEYEQLHPSIGWLQAEEFRPDKWRGNWPNAAFNNPTVRDSYWGAKLVGSFTDEQIAAAVAEGRLPARAAEILTGILATRRDKVVEHWYAKVTPIERPAVSLRTSNGRSTLAVSFDDLGLEAGVWTAGESRYLWRFEDPASRTLVHGERAARAGTRQTLQLELSESPTIGRLPAEREFATLRVRAIRPGAANREAVFYMICRGPEMGYEVVGLEH